MPQHNEDNSGNHNMFHIKLNATSPVAFLQFQKSPTSDTSCAAQAFMAVFLLISAISNAQGLTSKYLDDSGLENDPTVVPCPRGQGGKTAPLQNRLRFDSDVGQRQKRAVWNFSLRQRLA